MIELLEDCKGKVAKDLAAEAAVMEEFHQNWEVRSLMRFFIRSFVFSFIPIFFKNRSG